MERERLQIGIDIGSTTTKIVAVNQDTDEITYSDYRRHSAQQVQSVIDCLKRLKERFPAAELRMALTGSGAKKLADRLGLSYVQEVVANSIAIRKLYKEVRTAIELGGQDAKVLFFRKDDKTGRLDVADMRMNGSCAGGTGAFLDEVAAILRIPVEQLNHTAEQGESVYDISGRCGVYAKTDIQPLLNQGVSKANLALSSFHAVAKQTIGGLAQGLDIKGPVLFEGGPMTFNPQLIRVFSERLELPDEEVLVPEHPEIMVAYGAALSLQEDLRKRMWMLFWPVWKRSVRKATRRPRAGRRSFLKMRKKKRNSCAAMLFRKIPGIRSRGRKYGLIWVLTPEVPRRNLS